MRRVFTANESPPDQHIDFHHQMAQMGSSEKKAVCRDHGGRGWKSTFLTDDKSVAEERATKLGIRLEWMEDDGVKRITRSLPVVRYDKSRQLENLVHQHGRLGSSGDCSFKDDHFWGQC
ncbi:hypothetical protein Ddye_007679 [Dipteronia dyeriana]|uniref:Uncharacterized protein n=1 Tax=Dipteronia dyeriana TaxID=168575 RepID=A0AAD9XKW0_9ROSI|nr:hypothetical protein Ddye_007679 [Dipteronia dyeriana]